MHDRFLAGTLVLTGALTVGNSFPAGAQQPAKATVPLVLDRVTVVDVEQGTLAPNQRVVIVGNRIQRAGARSAVKLPTHARVVDASGRYLIPGLWDMHVHPWGYTSLFYPLLLANGVTGIRDAGSTVSLDTLIQLRREILAGTRVGPPRQLLSGRPIDACPGKNLLNYYACAADPADARRLVDSLHAAGADIIKIYNGYLSRPEYFAIAAEARRLGIPFGGHLGGGTETAGEASDSGAGLIDHMMFNSGGLDTLCWSRSATVERCELVAGRLRRNNTWLVPTMLILCGRGKVFCARFYRRAREFGQYWPDSVLNGTATASRAVADQSFYQQILADSLHYDSVISAAQQLHPSTSADPAGKLVFAQRVGLPILAGTDSYSIFPHVTPGFSLHAELAGYVEQGLTPLAALQAATLNPAKFLHATDSLGTVGTGKLADLVLLDADPLIDITNTTKIRAVIANGRYFDRAALDQLLEKVKQAR